MLVATNAPQQPATRSLAETAEKDWYFAFLVAAIPLAIITNAVPFLGRLFLLGFVLYSVHRVVTTRDKGLWSLQAMAYLVGSDVFFRMGEAYLLYELAKYAVAGLALLSMLYRTDRPPLSGIIFFFILLLPSILAINLSLPGARKYILFALSGPLALAAGCLRFSSLNLSKQELFKILRMLVPGALSMAIIVYLRSPSFDDVVFTNESNPEFSGGFGPNQVSTLFGIAALSVGFIKLMGFKLWPRFPLFDYLLLAVFFVFGFMTLSRGGMFSLIGASIAMAFVKVLFQKRRGGKKRKAKSLLPQVAMFVLLAVVGFKAVDNLTGTALSRRYGSVFSDDQRPVYAIKPGEEKVADQSVTLRIEGRTSLAGSEMDIFRENPILGVGPGMTIIKRIESGQGGLSSHTEFTRLLGEHGIFGLMALLIMVLLPIREFFKKNNMGKILLAGLIVFSFVSMFHAAMRIAAIPFAYALAMVWIKEENDEELA